MALNAKNPQNLNDVFYINLGKFFSNSVIDNDQKDVLLLHAENSVDHWESECFSSPIEQRIFAYMLFMTDGYEQVIFELPYDEKHIENGIFYIQREYKIGSYRADFAFIFQNREHKKIVVVECDGHDFHEKTKEQAAHDKKRDRYFASKNITTLRFTGSEIYNKCEDCIEEIEIALCRIKDSLWVAVEMALNNG